MRVSYQWLSEYVDLTGYTAQELAEKLTRGGVEVDVVESRNQGVRDVVVGLVKSCESHPDADKLRVCTVDAGQSADLQIVCGAPNVAAGQKVPVAVVGAILPGNFKIKKAKLRGVESHGMICSAKELGLNDRLLPKEIQEGILVLPEDLAIGTDIKEVLGLNDEVLELDLTPNRSDCLSMIGTAYEIGALIEREIRLPDIDLGRSTTKTGDKVQVDIDAPEQCSHYAARLVEGIKIAPSPLWMQNRLMAAGIRPINNIVDITNYVMLEYGQPLHAFDADRLDEGGRIVVRMAQSGERMVTLDDVERTLDESMLLITDGVKPIALAGVMGGANTEVSGTTRRILLESARFDGGTVRRTSRQLGLRSESSLRFEKEVDPEGVIKALDRAASLMKACAGGEVAEGIAQERIQEDKPLKLKVDVDRVNTYLGTALTVGEISHIFDRLQFPHEREGDGTISVTVPSRRGDITLTVDLIEEIARLHGYDRIPTSLMHGVTTPGGLTPPQQVRRALRRILTGSGLHEAVTYSFVHPENKVPIHHQGDETFPIALLHPMSEDRSVLRTSLIPSLLETAAYNRNRGIENLALFELGKVYISHEESLTILPEEKTHLAILLSGQRIAEHWSGQSENFDFFDLKGIVEQCFDYLGITDIKYVQEHPVGFHPGRTASIRLSRDSRDLPLGWIGQLHPDMARERDLQDTYVLEMNLEPLYEQVSREIHYDRLPRYPAISRDIALVVDREVKAGDLVEAIRITGGPLLESVQVFDVYTGDKLDEGQKSIAYTMVFRDEERTLKDEEVQDILEQIVQRLALDFNADLRTN